MAVVWRFSWPRIFCTVGRLIPFCKAVVANVCRNTCGLTSLVIPKIGFRVLSGQGANIDTTTAGGRLVLGIFAALAEFERELIRERTIAGLSSARARGRNGGRPYTMTLAKLRLAQAAMAKRDTKVGDLCKELGVTRQTLYRFVDPKGELRADGTKLLKRKGQSVS